MAHHVEPMDVDCTDSDFDNKENTYQHSNVLPCTEKGYEELDVSELNMKLRYSMTPASSPMSKSYTGCLDSKNLKTDDSLHRSNENANLTRSLNSTITKNDSVIKSLKSLPLQSLPTEQFIDGNGNASVFRQLDSTLTKDANITVTVSGTNDIDENLSLPSSSSSGLHTPEVATPTKDIEKNGGSPIMRGLKSVLNMFRSSQSPIPPMEGENITVKLSPADEATVKIVRPQAVASTPIAAHKTKDGNISKRSSPYKDSIIFNDDLEKELNWKDETTIIFSNEKIPVHKMFFQQTKSTAEIKPVEIDTNVQTSKLDDNFNSTVEYMDISYNESMTNERMITELQQSNKKHETSVAVESDSEFVDCETTITKNESQILDSDETEEKDISLIANDHNLDTTKNISIPTDDNFAANIPVLSDVTGISLTDGEYTNETGPSDSDYSKETIEILCELEGFEKNASSKIKLLQTSLDLKENILQKVITEQEADTQEIITNVSLEKDKREYNNLTTESQENQLNIIHKVEKQAENNTAIEHQGKTYIDFDSNNKHSQDFGNALHVVSDVESSDANADTANANQKILETTIMQDLNNTESIIESILNMETHNECKINDPQQLNPNHDYVCAPHGGCSDSIDTNPVISNTDQNILDTTTLLTFVQDLKITQNQSIDTEISQLSTKSSVVSPKISVDTAPFEMLIDTQNNCLTEKPDILQTPKKPADVPLPDEKCAKHHNEIVSSETLTDTQNFKEAETPNVLHIEKPSDLLLPDEDDIDKEVFISEIPTTLPSETAPPPVIPQEILDINATQTSKELDVTKTIHRSLLDKISNNMVLPEVLNAMVTEPASEAETPTVLHIENLSDMPLPDENDIDKDVFIREIPATVPSETAPPPVIPQEILDVNATQTSKELDVTKTIDSSLSDIVVEHKISYDMVLPEVLSTIVTEPASEVETPNVLHIEKPSDLPLPDEDDIDKEVFIREIPATLPSETAPRPVIPPEILDINAPKTSTKFDVNKTIHTSLSDIVVEDKISNDLVLPEILNTIVSEPAAMDQFSEVQEAANTESKLDPKIFHEKPMETVPDSKFKSETVLLALSNMSSEMEPHISPEVIELTSSDTKSDLTETTDKISTEIIPESKIGDNMDNIIPGVVLPSNTLNLDKTYDNITQNAALNATVTKDNFEPTENKSQEELMDITMNETLNHSLDLPDLVNQTILITDEKMQNMLNTTNIADMLKLDEVANEPGISDNITNFEARLEKESIGTEETNDFKDFKTKSQKNEDESLALENQILITNSSVTTDKQSYNGSKNIQVSNVTKDSNVKISDEHSETFSNTPNVGNMEFKVTTVVDEEIMVSENNSTYVSLMAGVETVPDKIEKTFEEIESQITIKTNIASSPPITSKGYNFNFDEMDDPFATKTKIRLSPPLDTPTKPVEFEVPKRGAGNRRKSQPAERKKSAPIKKKFNTSFDVSCASKTSTNKIDTTIIETMRDKAISIAENIYETSLAKPVTETEDITKPIDTTQMFQEELNQHAKPEEKMQDTKQKTNCKLLETSDVNKTSIDSIATVSNEIKTTSSSDQSAYYSAGASSTESFQPKNVFNLPEIDDVNFNPFATKSKMRQSPPPDLENENPFATRTKTKSSPNISMIVTQHLEPNSTAIITEAGLAKQIEKFDAVDKIETELMEKDTSANITNTTSSSKATDLNLTTREVNTEDEDTIEGPFLEAEDVMDKMSDFEADDLPAQEAEDNLEGGELFIDAEAFEFLLNQNKSNVVADSGKESLFLKFDPLFARKISSDGVLAALSQVQKRQSTPTKPARPSLRNEASPIAGPSTLNVTYEGDINMSQESVEDVNITVSKPMMVVTPAVNPAVTPRTKSITPNRSNRRSITFTSPAIAVIDRLLSMSANNSLIGQDTTMTHLGREQTEADLALTQLRELLAEKEISVYNLRSESKELKDRLATMESQVRILESDGQERLKKINELNERLAEKMKLNKSMAAVVEEYERTIASLIAATEQDKKRNAEERIRLMNERDEQTTHLASMEVSFSDLHSKYEKSKQVIFAFKSNEETYKKSLNDFEKNFTKMQTNYEMLKQHATSKLNHANQELEKMNRAHETEVVKLNAMIKRKDMHITSLEETLAQKTKANEELTAICDELINKVG